MKAEGHVVLLSQGMSKIASTLPESRGKAWDNFFLTALEGCQHLDLEVLA
jgi:hypothetical protein